MLMESPGVAEIAFNRFRYDTKIQWDERAIGISNYTSEAIAGRDCSHCQLVCHCHHVEATVNS